MSASTLRCRRRRAEFAAARGRVSAATASTGRLAAVELDPLEDLLKPLILRPG